MAGLDLLMEVEEVIGTRLSDPVREMVMLGYRIGCLETEVHEMRTRIAEIKSGMSDTDVLELSTVGRLINAELERRSLCDRD